MTQQRCYAVIGAGAVGCLVGGALAHAGHRVVFLADESRRARWPGIVHVASPNLGDFEVACDVQGRLEERVDATWVAVKSYDLPGALKLIRESRSSLGIVIPLMNGIGHVETLRDVGSVDVVPGVIRVHAEREGPNRVRHYAWHGSTAVELSPADDLCAMTVDIVDDLRAANVPAIIRTNAQQMLWDKLIDLSSIGLACVIGGTMGGVLRDPALDQLRRDVVAEVVAVARGLGAMLDEKAVLERQSTMNPNATSSLQRDMQSGQPIELEALTDPVIAEGERQGLSVRSIRHLKSLVMACRPEVAG